MLYDHGRGFVAVFEIFKILLDLLIFDSDIRFEIRYLLVESHDATQ